MNSDSENRENKLLVAIVILFVIVLIGTGFLITGYQNKKHSIKQQKIVSNQTNSNDKQVIVLDNLSQTVQIFMNKKGTINTSVSQANGKIINYTNYYQDGRIIAFKLNNNAILIEKDEIYYIIDHSSQTITTINKSDTQYYLTFQQKYNTLKESSIINEISTQYSKKPYLFMSYGDTIYDYTSIDQKTYLQFMIQPDERNQSFIIHFTQNDHTNEITINGKSEISESAWNIELDKYIDEYTITNNNEIIESFLNE